MSSTQAGSVPFIQQHRNSLGAWQRVGMSLCAWTTLKMWCRRGAQGSDPAQPLQNSMAGENPGCGSPTCSSPWVSRCCIWDTESPFQQCLVTCPFVLCKPHIQSLLCGSCVIIVQDKIDSTRGNFADILYSWLFFWFFFLLILYLLETSVVLDLNTVMPFSISVSDPAHSPSSISDWVQGIKSDRWIMAFEVREKNSERKM